MLGDVDVDEGGDDSDAANSAGVEDRPCIVDGDGSEGTTEDDDRDEDRDDIGDVEGGIVVVVVVVVILSPELVEIISAGRERRCDCSREMAGMRGC